MTQPPWAGPLQGFVKNKRPEQCRDLLLISPLQRRRLEKSCFSHNLSVKRPKHLSQIEDSSLHVSVLFSSSQYEEKVQKIELSLRSTSCRYKPPCLFHAMCFIWYSSNILTHSKPNWPISIFRSESKRQIHLHKSWLQALVSTTRARPCAANWSIRDEHACQIHTKGPVSQAKTKYAPYKTRIKKPRCLWTLGAWA